MARLLTEAVAASASSIHGSSSAFSRSFRATTGNLLVACSSGGVQHVVLLSIVRIDCVPDVACYQAKFLQEQLLQEGPIPYSVVRTTRFMEFVDALADVATGARLGGMLNVAGLYAAIPGRRCSP